jgi:predicted DCC family thiol-disulfide oxidoreductase YuxK
MPVQSLATTHADPPAPPSPEERPDADVVIFDGNCGFCRTQVDRLQWWDCQGRLAYLSLHDEEVRRRWPDLDHDRLMREMLVIDRQGRRHWGPEAFRYLTRRLRRLWWAAPLLHFPGAMLIARPVYRCVARNRYRFSGPLCGSDACQLHRD